MGVCITRKDEDTVSENLECYNGKRLPYFCYSGKEILSISKYEKKVIEEIARVKDLKDGTTSGWVISTRPIDGTIFADECVGIFKSVGKITKKKLIDAGFTKVKQFIFPTLSQQQINNELTSISQVTGISISAVRKLHLQAKNAISGPPPPAINHLKADNPYLSRYGEDEWKEKIKTVSTMTKYCCIKDLVLHIDAATKDAFKGTKYEDSYLIYHDALSTMCDKDCKKWMDEVGILKRWIRPVLGLNDEIIIVDENGIAKRNIHYSGRPVGDCPETMPLDNSLFRDFRCSFDFHVTMTCMLPRTDPRRFSKATPKLIGLAVKRIWDPLEGVAPISRRIVQDILRLTENFNTILLHEGRVVRGICDRNGHRRKSTEGDGRCYHARLEDQSAVSIDKIDLHKDCVEVTRELYFAEKDKFFNVSVEGE